MRTILTTLACLLVFTLAAQSKMAAFTKLEVDGPIEIELVVGEQRQVEVLRQADMVMWEINGETLVIIGSHRDELEVAKVRVTVTDLEILETTGAVVIKSENELDAASLQLVIHGQSVVDLKVDVMSLGISADQQSVLVVKGTADRLKVTADHQSVVDANGLTTSLIKAMADRQSIIHLNRSGAQVETNTQRQSIID